MKILHVTMVDPQVGQGGLSKYCKELMECETAMGHNVSVIYPGKLGSKSQKVIIKKAASNYFTIHGALPAAITYGIDNPERYMASADSEIYRNWLAGQNYDIIHVHSIQGIHREFFLSAKWLEIPMVFTTHDYYPICMKCNLVDENNQICEEHSPFKCQKCNAVGGLTYRDQAIRQSKIYHRIKTQKWHSAALKNYLYLKNFLGMSRKRDALTSDQAKAYSRYNSYRKDIFNTFTLIHCNSFETMKIYKRFFPNKKYDAIPITHAGLKRLPKEKNETSVYNIGYMGGMSRHKGYDIFESALDKLKNIRVINWVAWFYGGPFLGKKDSERRKYCKYFTKAEEEDVWSKLDILVVPSQWRETFGFVVQEALCHGIPVICSDLVGSKDLVKQLDGHLIFQYNNINSLADAIAHLLENADYYNCLCEKIGRLELDISMETHTEKIIDMYKSLAVPGKIS